MCIRDRTDVARPKRTIELSNCVVVEEAVKASGGKTFHVFSLWVQGTLESERGPGSGALLSKLGGGLCVRTRGDSKLAREVRVRSASPAA